MSWQNLTVQSVVNNARALIDEYVVDGVPISSDTNYMKSLQANAILYINMGLRTIYKDSKNYKTFEISNKQIPNLIGTQFNKVDFIGDDKNYPDDGVVGAKAYYFEVDSDATVYIEEFNGSVWNVLNTINVVTDVPNRQKGLITATDQSYPIRIRFSGTTFYRHQNRCLFSYPFKASAIPDYRPWVPIELPEDFGEIEEVIVERQVERYENMPNYKMEGFNEMYINYFFEGDLRVIYSVQVTEVTQLTDSVILPNPIALEFLNNFVAARSAFKFNPAVADFYAVEADKLLFQAKDHGPAQEEQITNVFNGGYYGYQTTKTY